MVLSLCLLHGYEAPPPPPPPAGKKVELNDLQMRAAALLAKPRIQKQMLELQYAQFLDGQKADDEAAEEAKKIAAAKKIDAAALFPGCKRPRRCKYGGMRSS